MWFCHKMFVQRSEFNSYYRTALYKNYYYYQKDFITVWLQKAEQFGRQPPDKARTHVQTYTRTNRWQYTPLPSLHTCTLLRAGGGEHKQV